MRLAAIALVAAIGCAGARMDAPNGRSYSVWAIGAGRAAAGKCDRVASDESVATKDYETRTTKDDERGTECVSAGGGRGSPGLWATVAAGFSALVLLVSGAL